jgi:predicted secreted protein
MPLARLLALAAALLAAAGIATAQGVASPPPQNVVQLAATGSVEVQQDLLTLSLTTTREAADAATVQAQLKAALEAALAEAKREAQPGQLDVRTGHFGLAPRYGRDGKVNGWQGSAELVLEGRDFPRITQTAARIQTLTVAAVSFSLSRQQRSAVEGEAQSQAIERFKARAATLAREFGFSGYSLREVAVTSNEHGSVPRPRMMAMEAKSASADAPLPVEAGKSTVAVTVSGSVQLR